MNMKTIEQVAKRTREELQGSQRKHLMQPTPLCDFNVQNVQVEVLSPHFWYPGMAKRHTSVSNTSC